jgi:hypothetical protein
VVYSGITQTLLLDAFSDLADGLAYMKLTNHAFSVHWHCLMQVLFSCRLVDLFTTQFTLWYRQSKRNLMKAFEHHLSVGDSDGGQFSLYLLSLIHRAYLISSDFMRRFISLNQQIFVNNTITIIIFVYMTSQNFDLFLWSTGLLNTNLLKYRWTPEETVKEQLHEYTRLRIVCI